VWEAVHLIEGLLANKSDIQPSTVHADTQGQSAPVFALATLFGFDLMPRIRNFKDLIFFRPGEHLIYPHIDALFGERGRNVIDWKLIERHCSLVKSIVGLKCVGSGELAGGAVVLRKRRGGSDAGDAVLAHLAQSPRECPLLLSLWGSAAFGLAAAAGKTGMAVIAGGGRAVPVREEVA